MATLVPCRTGRPHPGLARHVTVGLGAEMTAGVKHTYLDGLGCGYAIQKGPTDYLFTVSLTLQNVADGSRYLVEDTADDSDIASGVQSGTGDIVISGIGYAGSTRTLRVRVRKGSSATKYLPFETLVQVGAAGASSYILQTVDPIA